MTTFKGISAGSIYIRFKLRIQILTHSIKGAWHLRLKPQRRPMWKKSDITITQIGDEVKVVGEDRRQSNFY